MRPYICIVQTRLPAPPLIWRIDMIVFALAFVIVLYAFMIFSAYPIHHGLGSDLPRVSNAIVLHDADREDAIIISIARDGKIFYRAAQVQSKYLPLLVRDSMYGGAKREIFFRVDARARVGTLLEALDAVRPTGIQRIAFFAEQRRQPLPQ